MDIKWNKYWKKQVQVEYTVTRETEVPLLITKELRGYLRKQAKNSFYVREVF